MSTRTSHPPDAETAPTLVREICEAHKTAASSVNNLLDQLLARPPSSLFERAAAILDGRSYSVDDIDVRAPDRDLETCDGRVREALDGLRAPDFDGVVYAAEEIITAARWAVYVAVVRSCGRDKVPDSGSSPDELEANTPTLAKKRNPSTGSRAAMRPSAPTVGWIRDAAALLLGIDGGECGERDE